MGRHDMRAGRTVGGGALDRSLRETEGGWAFWYMITCNIP